MTTRRYDRIQAHAAHLITQAGGVAHIDSLALEARRYTLLSLYKQLQADQGIVRDTARQHIARACRKARHPDYTPPRWGGDRTPPEETSPMYETIFATPDNDGKWTLTNSKGQEVQEGYQYPTKAAALAAAPQLWPTNSVWQGKKVTNGWRIKTD